ncbi:ribonuclease HII [Micrococcaceae sp. AOP34-BR2-30]
MEQELRTQLSAGPTTMLIAGMDEVGRGALAGPVTVGVAAVEVGPETLPLEGLRDSKALSPTRRAELEPRIVDWCDGVTAEHASAAEIDEYGISAALALAARRSWTQLVGQLGRTPDILLLDGRDNWLRRAPQQLIAEMPELPQQIHLRVKADVQCATVASAAIFAKVVRDRLMVTLDEELPAFGWKKNKGYGAAVHRDALIAFGPTSYHRRSWNLTGGHDPNQGALL